MEVPFPQSTRPTKSPLLFTNPFSIYSKITRRRTELPKYDTDPSRDPILTNTEGAERPSPIIRARNYMKRLSLDFGNVETPNVNSAVSAPISRKTAAQLRQELDILEDFGIKTAAAVPTELDVFHKRHRTKLGLSTIDLWGPDHARTAIRAMGFYDAFRTIEDRDKRLGLALETASTAKFNPRMADDLTIMKSLNKPMVRSVSNFELRIGSKTDRAPIKRGSSKRLRKIFQIMDSCDRLTKESRALRKTFTPLEEILLRRQRLTRLTRK